MLLTKITLSHLVITSHYLNVAFHLYTHDNSQSLLRLRFLWKEHAMVLNSIWMTFAK